MAVQFGDSKKEPTEENRSDMPASHRNFGNLLEEGIKRVHITRKKPIGYILDEFGYELRPDDSSKGRYAVGHWYYKKRIPASMEDVTRLATLIVTNSDVDRDWLKAFLDSAGYPDSDKFCDQFFISTASEKPVAVEGPVEPENNNFPERTNETQPETINPAKSKQPWLIYGLGLAVLLTVFMLGWNQWSKKSTPVRANSVPSFTVPPVTPDFPAAQATQDFPVTQAAILPTTSPTASLVMLDGNCPEIKSVPAFEYDTPASFRNYLNSGGSFIALKETVSNLIQKKSSLLDGQAASSDLNVDGVPEIIVSVVLEKGSLWQILGCDGGQYQPLVEIEEPDVHLLRYAVDLNGNRYPEIISYRQTLSGSVPVVEFFIQEWQNGQVVDLMDNARFDEVGRRLSLDITDWQREIANATGATIDANGLGELVITGGLSARNATCETRFERQFTEHWIWNGKSMQLQERVYDEPAYRFQRSADGDLAFAMNHLEDALSAYQDVLFRSDLYERDQYIPNLAYCKELGTPADTNPIENEWDQLAAYARWRILLINALKGSQDAMQVVYDTLQEKFPEGKPGHAYAVIASAFWENYQLTQNLQDACEAANSAAESQKLYPAHQAENICFVP